MSKTKNDEEPKRRRPPAKTPEARENQVIASAYDLAERQILDGTASSQVIAHFLKLGSSQARLEKEKLRLDNELTKAKTEAVQSAKRVEELYSKALDAMRTYSGRERDEDEII